MRGLMLMLAAASLALLAGAAQAQDENKGAWAKFSLAVGGFVTESDTTVQINSETLGVGAIVDLENTLGVERSVSTYRIDARYRFGETRRHEVEFHYFSSKRTGDKTLEEDLQIGDEFFPAGTGVVTEFDLRFANVDYVYNFLMDDRVRLGVSVGLHTTGIGLKLNEVGGAIAEDESFTAPLPMVGLRSDVILTPRWRMKIDVNLFYLEYDKYTGRLGDTYVGVEYLPWKNFGFGAGFNYINYQIEVDPGSEIDFYGQVKFQLTGFLVYGKYFF